MLVTLPEQPQAGRHSAGPADDLAHLSGQYHVGLSREGNFPHHESNCPCPKGACGLAAPRADVPCEQHHKGAGVLQFHTADQCKPRIKWIARRRSHKDAANPQP